MYSMEYLITFNKPYYYYYYYPTLHFLKNQGNLLHNCFIFISNMPHNGFIYEARMDMMENSGHCSMTTPHVSGATSPLLQPWRQLNNPCFLPLFIILFINALSCYFGVFSCFFRFCLICLLIALSFLWLFLRCRIFMLVYPWRIWCVWLRQKPKFLQCCK